MKKMLCYLLAVAMLLSGCGNVSSDSDNSNASMSVAVKAHYDEQSLMDEILNDLPEAYADNGSIHELTLYRMMIPDGYELAHIERRASTVLYRYQTPNLKEKIASGALSSNELAELRVKEQIHFSWMTLGKDFTKAAAEDFLQIRVKDDGLVKYGDTDYYVNVSVQRKDASSTFAITWRQDNQVFQVRMPGFSEISEETIADYCRAEAFPVSTTQNIN